MSAKTAINRLVSLGVKRTEADSAPTLPGRKSILNSAKKEPPPDANTIQGLADPLQMDVLTTTTVSIPVPVGATSVDVEVIQSYTLTDANGTVYTVTVNAYP